MAEGAEKRMLVVFGEPIATGVGLGSGGFLKPSCSETSLRETRLPSRTCGRDVLITSRMISNGTVAL